MNFCCHLRLQPVAVTLYSLTQKEGVLRMAYRTRIKYSEEQFKDIRDRWQEGETLIAIGRIFDRSSSSIFGLLSPTGGIRSKPRKHSRFALTLSEREDISRGIAKDYSVRHRSYLERASSTISLEINRNGYIIVSS